MESDSYIEKKNTLFLQFVPNFLNKKTRIQTATWL